MNGSRLLRRSEAANYIRERYGVPCSPKTLAKLAVVGGGPLITFVGRWPMHSEAALDAWVAAKTAVARSTSERPHEHVAA